MVAQTLENEVARIVRLHDPRAEVYLYGSRARGESTPESDWDFILVLEEPQREEEIRDDMCDLALETGAVISLLVHSKVEWNVPEMRDSPFRRNIRPDLQPL
jgi:predicted nucleotidyltransferase